MQDGLVFSKIFRPNLTLLLLSLFIVAGGGGSGCNKKTRDNVDVVPMNDRLELFVDEYMIDQKQNVTLELHSPTPANKAIEFNEPWEGNLSSDHLNVFQDTDVYRMYYRGLSSKRKDYYALYAESKDGITWYKPKLGIVKFGDNDQNNILMTGLDNFAAWKDTNPNATKEAQYKGIGSYLFGYSSSDAIHWKLTHSEPLIPKARSDSTTTAFWDPGCQCYRAYARTVIDGFRGILWSFSYDFENFSEGVPIDLGNAPKEQLYTNGATPYFRAPHIFIAFPMRYQPSRNGVSEGIFLSSRDGVKFDHRFLQGWIKPGLNYENWGDRNNMPAWGLLQTGASELSVYYSRAYRFDWTYLERGTLRLDGFVSVHSGIEGGEFTTKILTMTGRNLILNMATSTVGSVKVDILDASGNVIPNFSSEDNMEPWGDQIEHVVMWRNKGDLANLIGRPIKLRFKITDGDLYSMRFGEISPRWQPLGQKVSSPSSHNK